MVGDRQALLSVKDMRVTYGTGRHSFEAVRGVSFDIFKGETFGLAGESGSGKTTIGRSIIRMYPLSGGEVLWRGQRISGRIDTKLDREVIRSIQMIFQDPMASLNERAKVDYIVAEGLYNVRRDITAAERTEMVHDALKDVGLLPEFASRFPHEFSGGQRQRIGIARALIMNPECIIADEPISALDVSIRAQVLNLLSAIQKERGLTYLFVAHDLSIMKFITDRIAIIRLGEIVELANTPTLFEQPLHPYTRALISAVPIPNPRVERTRRTVAYNPAVHDYSRQQPTLREIEPGHFVMANDKEAGEYSRMLRAGA